MRVLSAAGGGAKGAAQLAMFRRLLSEGMRWDAIAGTSVGAIHTPWFEAASMHDAAAIELLVELYRRPDLERLIHRRYNTLVALARQALGIPGWYDNQPLLETLRREMQHIPQPQVSRVSWVDLDTARGEYGPATPENIHRSATMPGVWAAVEGRYVDGGIRDIAPVRGAVAMGATETTVLLCSPLTPETWKPSRSPIWRGWPTTVRELHRSLEIALHEVMLCDLEQTRMANQLALHGGTKKSGEPYRHVDVYVIAPDEPLGDSLDFSAEHLAHCERVGTRAAENFLRRYGSLM